jgi:O-antigen/teichoic acid export membrane protein
VTSPPGTGQDPAELTDLDRARGDIAVTARGASLNLIGSAVQGAMRFALVVVATRGLGASGAGAFLIAVAIFQIATRVGELGVSTGLIRSISQARVSGREAELRRATVAGLVPVLAVGTVLAVVLTVLAAPLADLFSTGSGTTQTVEAYLRPMALLLPASALYTAVVEGTRGFSSMVPVVAIDRIGRSVIQPLLVALAIATTDSETAVALAYALPFLVLLLPSAWSYARSMRFVSAGSAAPDESWPASVRSFWSFTGPRSLGSIFQVTMLWLDTLLVGGFLTAADAALYAGATRYLMAVTLISMAIRQVVQPMISECFATEDHTRASALVQTATGWLTVMALPFYVLVAVFTDAFLAVLGPEFIEARWVLVILAPAVIISMTCGPADTVLLMSGRSLASLFNTGAALGANIVLNLLLIPRWGIEGAAASWAVSLLIANVTPAIQVARATGIQPVGPGVRKVLEGSLGLVVVCIPVMLVLGRGFVGLTVALLIGGTGYCAFVWRHRAMLHLPELAEAMRRRGSRRRDPVRAASGVPLARS